MIDFINSVISHFQTLPVWSIVLFSFISACIQQFFPPYPSEILLLLLGGIAIIDLNAVPATILPYVIGTILSSLALFYLSRRLGKPILKNKYVRKVFPRRNQCKAQLYMKKFGTPSLAICKFLPGVNTVCLIVAGVMGLRGIAPVLTIVFAGIAENVIYFAAGMAIGENLPAVFSFSNRFSFISCAVIAAAVVCYVLFKVIGRAARKTGGAH